MALLYFLGFCLLPSSGASSVSSARDSRIRHVSCNLKDARDALVPARESQVSCNLIAHDASVTVSLSAGPHLPSDPSRSEALLQDVFRISTDRLKSSTSDGRPVPDLSTRDASGFVQNLDFLHPNRNLAGAGVQPDVGMDINGGDLRMAKGLKGKVILDPIKSSDNASLSHSFADALSNRNPRLNFNGGSSLGNSCHGRILKKDSSAHVEADPTALSKR